jgi:hypothetical protein
MAHQATFSWTASTDTVAGYDVFRGTSSGGESTTPLNSSPITGTTYTDTTLTPGTWYYVAKSTEGGALSVASDEVVVVILPAPPTNFALVSSS